jgi:hypothetical protein
MLNKALAYLAFKVIYKGKKVWKDVRKRRLYTLLLSTSNNNLKQI